MNVCGACKMCEKQLKPADLNNLPKIVEAPKVVEAPEQEEKAAEADEDEFDPFAD